jgi:protein-S-isoprenylcysteine O-methyltransferase Ste14
MHNTTLVQERFCLEEYGQAYRDYVERVPRYFLFF